MLEVITKPNSLWVADFCFLTRRIPKKFHDYRLYNKPHTPRPRGNTRINIGENVVFLPKWLRWNYDSSQFNKWTRREFKPKDRIKVYDSPVVLFAIQDVASRLIVHACLKHAPKEIVSRSYQYPHWFKLDECLKQSLQTLPNYSHKLHFALDSMIQRKYSKSVLGKWIDTFPITSESKFLSSTLEAFFGRLQYEFRDDLTQKNLDTYIKFWNNERTMKVLNNKTPSSIYYSDYY